MVKKVFLNYNLNKFLAADYTVHSGTSVHHVNEENKDIFKKHGISSLPSTYVDSNTQMHQVWWEDNSIKAELSNIMKLDVQTVSSIKQNPGNTIPIHRDQFFKIYKDNPSEKRKMVRINIFLEDWKTGHFLQYNDTIVNKWKAGQGYMWDNTVEHLSCNAGLLPKYTLQISGFLNGS